MNADKVFEIFSKNGIITEKEKCDKFAEYCNFLLEYNKNVNLTAIVDEDEVVISHFVDSLFGEKLLPQNAKCADIGTGAGFPGVPLAIMRDDISVLLVDSLQKRIDFLRQLAKRLELKNVSFLHGRSEDIAQNTEYRQKFDIVFSRAVARLNVLCELDLPFVRQGGAMLAWKGSAIEEELAEAQNAVKILGAEYGEQVAYLIDGKERYIQKIVQNSLIPKKYPRQAGTPKRKPL